MMRAKRDKGTETQGTKSREHDPELSAIRRVRNALEGLTVSQARRVLAYVQGRYADQETVMAVPSPFKLSEMKPQLEVLS